MTYKVESGVPIPPVQRKAKSFAAVLRGMKKGQSVKVKKERLWRKPPRFSGTGITPSAPTARTSASGEPSPPSEKTG